MSKTWRNWANTAQAHPKDVYAPDSAEAVRDHVIAARDQGRTIRMIGSGHSFTQTAVADDIMLKPTNLTGIRKVDDANALITLEAGIDLTQLCLELDRHSLALTNMGDVRVQSLAGAIQTSTHGTGRTSGTFADMVTEFEIVTADGQIRTVNSDQDPALFNAARVGIGAFGIITAITLAVEPSFRLHAHEFPADYNVVLGSFDEWANTHDHVEFYWFPHTDKCIVKHNDRSYEPAAPVSKTRAWIDDELIANKVFGATCRLARTAPGYTPLINRVATKVLSEREYTDVSWKVLTSTRTVKFEEMEYALPREVLLDAVRDVRELIEKNEWDIAFPIEVRIAPRDDAWLSTATGRATGYLAVHVFARMDRSWYADVEAIMKSYGGRPHWGKLHTRTAADLAPAYPHWSQMLDVRNRVDPDRTFANAYTRQVLGE